MAFGNDRTLIHFDMSSEKEEAREEALLTAEISKCLRRHCGDGGDMFDFAVESILADVQEDGVPKDVDEAMSRWSSTLEDCELTPFDDDDDDEDASELVVDMYGELIERIQSAMAEARGEVEEYLAADQCEMCERVTPLTRHHLFPTSEHDHQEAQPMPAGQVVARGRRGVQAVPHRHPRVRRREDPRRELQHHREPAGGGTASKVRALHVQTEGRNEKARQRVEVRQVTHAAMY